MSILLRTEMLLFSINQHNTSVPSSKVSNYRDSGKFFRTMKSSYSLQRTKLFVSHEFRMAMNESKQIIKLGLKITRGILILQQDSIMSP